MSDREEIEAGLLRNYGMLPGRREQLKELYELFPDWQAFCPKCKKAFKGTLSSLREHKCGAIS